MNEITPNELKRLFPNASASTIRNNQAGGLPSPSEPQHAVRHDVAATAPAEKGNPPGGRTRYRVTICDYRKRLTDIDNLCGKFHLDCLRYLGLIPDDSPAHIDLYVRQEKVPGAQVRTEIVIEPL